MQADAKRRLAERYAPVVTELRQTFGTRLKTVVLFGSQARGDATTESDHDLFVVVQDLPIEPIARQRLLRGVLLPILHALSGSVAFIGRTPEEFAATVTPLLLDICTDGICLFGSNFFEPYRRKVLATVRRAGLEREELGEDRVWMFREQPARNWELSWEGFREGV